MCQHDPGCTLSDRCLIKHDILDHPRSYPLTLIIRKSARWTFHDSSLPLLFSLPQRTQPARQLWLLNGVRRAPPVLCLLHSCVWRRDHDRPFCQVSFVLNGCPHCSQQDCPQRRPPPLCHGLFIVFLTEPRLTRVLHYFMLTIRSIKCLCLAALSTFRSRDSCSETKLSSGL